MCAVASVKSNSLWSYGPWPTRLLCSWDSPGKNTGVVAMPFSKGSSWPRDQICVSYVTLCWQVGSLLLVPPVMPQQVPGLVPKSELSGWNFRVDLPTWLKAIETPLLSGSGGNNNPGSEITINEISPRLVGRRCKAEGKALWDHNVVNGNYEICYMGWLLSVAVQVLLKENDRLRAASC